MLTDSHCHLTFDVLQQNLSSVLSEMAQAQVTRALCICTTLEEAPSVQQLAARYPHLWATVGVHPDNEGVREPTVADLVQGATLPKVIAIGETGLDYYQMEERKGGRSIGDMAWQRERFRVHIRAARQTGLPLIIHTRQASDDTLAILREEGAGPGVFHCFTETLEVARAALDAGFYISFSGILTFKNAVELKDVARWVPADRMLIETDSPYLAPVPYRGKTNQPAWVAHVAQCLADLRGTTVERIGQQTSANFDRLFPKAIPA